MHFLYIHWGDERSLPLEHMLFICLRVKGHHSSEASGKDEQIRRNESTHALLSDEGLATESFSFLFTHLFAYPRRRQTHSEEEHVVWQRHDHDWTDAGPLQGPNHLKYDVNHQYVQWNEDLILCSFKNSLLHPRWHQFIVVPRWRHVLLIPNVCGLETWEHIYNMYSNWSNHMRVYSIYNMYSHWSNHMVAFYSLNRLWATCTYARLRDIQVASSKILLELGENAYSSKAK